MTAAYVVNVAHFRTAWPVLWSRIRCVVAARPVERKFEANHTGINTLLVYFETGIRKSDGRAIMPIPHSEHHGFELLSPHCGSGQTLV
jgi:hypothetical protein